MRQTTSVSGSTMILTLDASGAAGALVAAVEPRGGAVLAMQRTDAARGVAAILPAMAQDVLKEAGRLPTLVAAVVGPGSFTGIRAALALAHGMGLALPAPVVGVSVAEALRAAAAVDADAAALAATGRVFWAAISARRGLVFLDRGNGPELVGLDALPPPGGPVAVGGDAAKEAAAALAARGHDVALLSLRRPQPLGIAAAALLRQAGRLPPRAAQPLYAEPPLARPATAARPPPPMASASAQPSAAPLGGTAASSSSTVT